MPKSNSKSKVKSQAKAKKTAPASKASKKPAKASKSIVKTLVKAAKKALASKPTKVGETGKKLKEKAVAAPLLSDLKKDAKKLEKKGKKAKTAKKESDELDLGDDLVGDEDLGTEEIPDLAEFDEVELEEIEEVEEVTVESRDGEGPKAPDEEVILMDAEGRRYCRVRDCDQIGVVEGYCRFHYMQLWKRIQIRRKILGEGKLERYVEELTSRYPDKFLEMIRKDLRTEKDFLGAIAELEIDESAVDSEFEDESASFIEEVRGLSENSPSMSDDDEF
jgi:hypothetical protein